MEALSYEQLFEALRREKSREELQELEGLFFERAHALVTQKNAAAAHDGLDSLSGQRAHLEVQNARRILREMYDRRERKIITLALHSTRTEEVALDAQSLLPQERALFEELAALLRAYRARTLHGAGAALPFRAPQAAEEGLRADEPELEPQQSVAAEGRAEEEDGDTVSQEELVQVRFVAGVPKFIGKDLAVFGPFEEGAIAHLPISVAQILIQKGRAQRL
jgi:DNA replication initiation complex subunit (GINS family)